MQVAMMSGPMDLTEKEFEQYYKPAIDMAMESDHHFVVGSAKGADTMCLEYLKRSLSSLKNVTVHYFGRDKTMLHHFEQDSQDSGYTLISGYKTATERDELMTSVSQYDIAHVRSPKTMKKILGDKFNPDFITGTQANVIRRESLRQRTV